MAMMHFKPELLQISSPLFIKDVNAFRHTRLPLILCQCRFAVDQFTPQSFAQWGIRQESHIRSSVRKRQAEYFSGRYLARMAMGLLFQQSVSQCPPILTGTNREPLWPQNTFGAVTHSNELAMVVIGESSAVGGLGIDCEQWLTPAMSHEIANQIHQPAEQQHLLLNGFSAQEATTLLFSAKESLFKALYPQIKQYFGFEQAFLHQHLSQTQQLIIRLKPEFANQHNVPRNYLIQYQKDKHHVTTLLILNE